MSTNDAYWKGYAETLHRIRDAKPCTFDEMKKIVDLFHPLMVDTPFCGDTFFPSGGEDTIADALRDAGWRLRFREGAYWYVAEHPETGEVFTYQEGDLRRKQDLDKDVVEFVRLGYHDVSLDFRVHTRNRATFNAAVKAVGGCYNRFDPRQIKETIGPVFDDAMSVEFGRESSPVLYIGIPYHPGQRLDDSAGGFVKRYSDEQRQDMTRRVIEWARSAEADEISVQQHPVTDEPVRNEPGDNPYMVRIWWD